MKKLLYLIAPAVGLLISTHGWFFVNEIHAERFNPSDKYAYTNLSPLKTSNKLTTLNKNQNILNIKKRDSAIDIVKSLRIDGVKLNRYIEMLHQAINDQEINTIVNTALKSSENNNQTQSSIQSELDRFNDLLNYNSQYENDPGLFLIVGDNTYVDVILPEVSEPSMDNDDWEDRIVSRETIENNNNDDVILEIIDEVSSED